ncbi:MAG TPA: HAMP domain-containing sensor histidine kinase [Alphaproteobacteria bacterium]|nr:HAMP domain-containing sensor histidine kinase [Alphaproteobacteria bacterium]
MMGQLERISRSFVVKILVLVAIFFAVPSIVYEQFRAADAEKNRLLLENVEAQGRIIAEALRPAVERIDGSAMRSIAQAVLRLGIAGPNIKLLFRRADDFTNGGFYYVASAPAVPSQYLEQERQDLLNSGVLDRLKDSCADVAPLGIRYTNPAGGQELLTSVIPIQASTGCWAVVTSYQSAEFLGSSIGQPYWQTGAVRFAAAIYLVMALIVTVLFMQAGLSLRRFGRLARNLRTGRELRGTFSSLNRIPELSWVAEEFDRLVSTLRSSAQALRFAAEETAHAFKTPIGIIAQSLEPFRRGVTRDDPRTLRALDIIDRSLERLDGLVSASRRLDETIADSINPPHEPVPLSALVQEIAEEYREAHEPGRVRIVARIEPGLVVIGAPSLLETIVQNICENALSFSPLNGEIEVILRARSGVAELSISDQGPGVAPDKIEQIFERFVSLRSAEVANNPPPGEPQGGKVHYGLGLWIVRRNVESMGGVVAAENRAEGGFRVVVALPLAR